MVPALVIPVILVVLGILVVLLLLLLVSLVIAKGDSSNGVGVEAVIINEGHRMKPSATPGTTTW